MTLSSQIQYMGVQRRLTLLRQNLDGSCSNVINLSMINSSNSNESKVPLDSLDNTTHPFHMSRMSDRFQIVFRVRAAHREPLVQVFEIEDQINACATQLSIISLVCQGMNSEALDLSA